MSRRILLAVTIGALVVLIGAPIVWWQTRPPDVVGDLAAVESALRPAVPTTFPVVAPDPVPVTSTTLVPPADQEPESPTTTYPYVVESPPAPVEVRIDRLGVDAPVGAYGVDGKGQMDVPDNVTEVGWYRFGPTPGAPGSAVLAAHVDLAGQGRGVFFNLKILDPGDLIDVVYDDGSVGTFKVVARAIYGKPDLPLDVVFAKQGPPILTLITCGGGFSESSRRYDSNVVVYAAPVDPDALFPVGRAG